MNKTLKISAVALAISLATGAEAHLVHANERVNTQLWETNVQLNLLPSMVGYLSGNVNVQVSPASAIGVYGGVWTWNRNIDNHHLGLNAYNLGLQYSYALNGQYMSTGWIAKPFIGYGRGSVEVSDNDDAASAKGISWGAVADYQWVFDNNLMVQVGLGAEHHTIHAESADGFAKDKTTGFGVTGEVNLGWGF